MRILLINEEELRNIDNVETIEDITMYHVKDLTPITVADRVIVSFKNEFKILKDIDEKILENLVLSFEEVMAYI